MKAVVPFLFLSLCVPFAHAIPNSFFGNGNQPFVVIPAFPRFNAELTEEFLTVDNWDAGKFSGPWQEEPALDGQFVRRMSANPVVFGSVPMSVYAYGSESGVEELAIYFLDAGQYFGYRYGGEKTREEREDGRERRAEFDRHFREISRDLERRLEDGCGRGTMGSIGQSEALRTVFTDYRWENFVLRFIKREDYSLSIHILKEANVPRNLADTEILSLGDREREALYASRVSRSEFGDFLVRGIPMFTQGNTPFCGIHSLAMAGHYYGLRVSTEALAAGADFNNTGSAKGSDILGLYRSAAAETGMRVSISPTFRADRVERAIEEGFPIIVWRRVSEEREKAHAMHRAAWEDNPSIALPKPSPKLLESYPKRDLRGTPSHASIITGMNPDRREVIYTEPWGDETRDRRMRYEEMEASVYAVFFFKL